MLPTVYRFGRKKNPEKLLIVWEIAESFRARRMSCPTVGYSPWTNLLEMDGTLGITHADESSMVLKLWVCFRSNTGIVCLLMLVDCGSKKASSGMTSSRGKMAVGVA